MCGVAGVVALKGSLSRPQRVYRAVFDRFLSHRGPDGHGVWRNLDDEVFLAHYRLAIIDVSPTAAQPMADARGVVITYNGEIYNYRELRVAAQQKGYRFRTASDTEAILAAYEQHGVDALSDLRGMFAFALWDESDKKLLLARDRFGIKPLYYCIVGDELYFASEIKALLPFLSKVTTNSSALAEYLTFQYTISSQTMFEGVYEVPPGHYVVAQNGVVITTRYWDVSYDVDFGKSTTDFESELRGLLTDSVAMHLRADVEVGAYVSGGLDSSLIYALASDQSGVGLKAFHGRFLGYDGFDESRYAHDVIVARQGSLEVRDISAQDFIDNISKVIYHLDQPVAGPGSFPQFMVSEMASKHVKVILGGQGGDEILVGTRDISLPILSSASRLQLMETTGMATMSSRLNQSFQILECYRSTSLLFRSSGEMACLVH